MRVILKPTSEQVKQLANSIQSAKAHISAYVMRKDTVGLKAALCDVIDSAPNLAYLDEDVLSCYGIEAEGCKWVVASSEEDQENRSELKRIVNEIEEFQSHHLSFASSGSILRTIFGDAYDAINRL